MGQGTGSATLSFPVSAQAAQYDVARQVVTDSNPNPSAPPKFTYSYLTGGAGTWMAAAYGNGFFLVASSGTSWAQKSFDGVTWTQLPTTPATLSAQYMVFVPGKFVLFPSSSPSGPLVSSDGATWTQKTFATVQNNPLPATDGDFKIISLNQSTTTNIAQVSSDRGETWSDCTMPSSAFWICPVYGAGQFLAFIAGSTSYATSPDGVTWSTASGTLPAALAWTNAAFDPVIGKFIIHANSGTTYYHSNDGVNWTSGTLLFGAGQIVAGNGRFVCSHGTQGFSYSIDGINWAAATYSGPTPGAGQMAFGNGGYVIATGNNNYLVGSPAVNRTISSSSNLIVAAKPSPGSNTASVTVTGLTGFTNTDSVEAWIMAQDTTADHNSFEHACAPIKLRVTNPVTGVGFTIKASSEFRLTGDFKVRYVYTS